MSAASGVDPDNGYRYPVIWFYSLFFRSVQLPVANLIDCKPSPSMQAPEQTFSTDGHVDHANQNYQETLPRLPPEIECEILTLALKLRRKDCTKLMCVAKRVEQW